MLYYPQLTTGSVCQFPVDRFVTTRTTLNDLHGGDRIRMADVGAATIRWQLSYCDLTEDEWLSIEELFESTQGRLGTFTFLDPTDNLLLWSEDWTQSAWNAGPLLEVSGGVPGPGGAGGGMQLINQSQATQRIMQLTSGAGWFEYALSVFVRSDAPSTAQLITASGAEEMQKAISLDGTWRRVAMGGRLASNENAASFGVQLPPGLRMEVFGAQVEAQPAAGCYKRTLDRGGIYTNARFDSDTLSRRADGPDQNSCIVSLLSSFV